MKTIWMILIGMVLFNGFLLAFDVFFEQSPQSSGLYNVNNVAQNETFEAYKKPGTLSFSVLAIGFTGIIVPAGFVMTVLTRDLKYLAAGGLIGLVSSIWTASASVFGDMMNSLNNPVLPLIYTMMSIAIGICVALLVLGIFTSQEQLS